MTGFDPVWGGLDYTQDTPPYDGMAITFLPSLVNDVTAGQLQLESEESVHSFMQTQFRLVSENFNDAGLMFSAGV